MTATGASAAETAFRQLAAADGVLADLLAGLATVVVSEARENPVFRARLNDVLGNGRIQVDDASYVPPAPPARMPAKARPKRGRRAPGPWDPYAVYADVGEAGLRSRLSELELEQLRDIVAEHGMNNDGLAMRWTKADRVIGRIVERVVDRAAKGDAFRSL